MFSYINKSHFTQIFYFHRLKFKNNIKLNLVNRFSSSRPFSNVCHDSYNLRNEIEKNFSLLINKIPTDIVQFNKSDNTALKQILDYNFEITGKLIRPRIIILLAAVMNDAFIPINNGERSKVPLKESQYKIAMIAEMIHTASLIHDDLIDNADTRRGIPSSVTKFHPREAVLAGDFMLTKASQLLASIGDTEVVTVISNLIHDLIKGEIMQLQSYDDINEKFAHYYTKTYRKTASLIANCTKSVAILTTPGDKEIIEAAYEFGRNSGLAFQLVDDILDFVADSEQLGKPGGGTDMKLGLATGPVLFAAEMFPEVHGIVNRKLNQPGDFETVMDYIIRANGIEKTKDEAKMFYDTSLFIMSKFPDTYYKALLLGTMDNIFYRTK